MTSFFPPPPQSLQSADTTELVFHYASPDALLGIIGGRQIWGSKIQFLNDEKEFREYLGHISTLASHIFTNVADEDYLDDLLDHISRAEMANIFVASFSLNGDKLSQWRGYCASGGVSLGFDREVLKAHFESLGWTFAEAIYGLPEREELAEELKQLSDRYRHQGLAGRSDEERDAFFAPFVRKLCGEAPRYKHPGFEEEVEWRVYTPPVPWDHEQVDAVSIRGALRPIFRFMLPENPVGDDADIGLRQINVSPGGERELRKDAARILLRRRRVYYERILLSGIPYTSR